MDKGRVGGWRVSMSIKCPTRRSSLQTLFKVYAYNTYASLRRKPHRHHGPVGVPTNTHKHRPALQLLYNRNREEAWYTDAIENDMSAAGGTAGLLWT